jgi:hypothetical protein
MRTNSRLHRIGARRFLSATGAVLSVFATLWATLVGQTVPQILASSSSPRARFLHAANHACSRLPAAPGMAEPGPGGQAELPRNVEMKTPDAIIRIQNDFNKRAYEPLELAERDLLALTAPAPYAIEYRTFEQLLGETVIAFDRLQQTMDFLDGPAREPSAGTYRRALASVLNANMAAFDKVTRLIAHGDLLQLNKCVLGLAGIGTQIELLNDTLIG